MPIARALRGHPRPLRSAAVVVAAWLVAASLGPAVVLGAGPGTTTVTVSVVDDETHEPLDGALVTLTGSTDGDAEPVYEDEATTDADGRATFDAVPLASGGTVVSLAAEASKSESATVDGCTTERTWTGASEPVAAAANLAIEVLASRADETSCDDPGPDAPVLRGLVVGPDGGPFSVFEASVAMTRADGAQWGRALEVAPDGRFSAPLQPWGTADDPADLAIVVNGSVVGHETEDGCTYDLAPRATFEGSVALADGHDPAEIALVAGIERVSGVCGTTGTPGPTATHPTAPGGASTPGPTLPPTDELAAAPRPDVAPIATLALALGSAAALGLLRRLRARPD